MNIINTLIIIIIGLIIVNLSCCYNIEGMSTSCNVKGLHLGDPLLTRTGDYTGFYKGSDGYYAGIRGRPGVTKIDSTKTQLLDPLKCLYDIGITDIMDVVEDPSINNREIRINSEKQGDYYFTDDQGDIYSLYVLSDQWWHNVDYFDAEKKGLIENISFTPLLPSWL
jgi:hypothetical protein